MSSRDADVVVFGGGLAALMACWELAESGLAVILACPADPVCWPVVTAGGLTLGDDPERLVTDTLAAGDYAAPRAPVRALAAAASPLVERLAGVGVPFAADRGHWRLRRLPGMSKADAVYVDTHTELSIGAALERHLAARFSERFAVVERVDLAALLLVEGRCCGIVTQHRETHSFEAITAGAVILAGGGPERMLGARTGALALEGPLAVAARAGAVLVSPHRCQQHPAVLATPRGLVVPTAALRAEGARLWVAAADEARAPDQIPHKERARFLDDAFPGWGELVPDDLATSALRTVLAERRGNDDEDAAPRHFLDVSHLPDGHLEERLGVELAALSATTGVDPSREPIEVVTAPLGLLGGLFVDHERSEDGLLVEGSPRNHATTLPGLYAAGPWASLYHGRCVMGGNGTLADLFGGSVAGRGAAAFIERGDGGDVTDRAAQDAIARAESQFMDRVEGGYGPSHAALEAELGQALTELLGPREYELDETLAEVGELVARYEAMPPEARAGEHRAHAQRALEDALTLARLIAAAVADESAEEGPRLARWDGEAQSAATFTVGERTYSCLIDEDGVAAQPRRYREREESA